MSLPLIVTATDRGAVAPGSYWSNKLLPAAVLVIGIALSVVASRSAQEETSGDSQSRLDTVAANAAVQVERRFAAYFEVLAGMRALFHTVDNFLSKPVSAHHLSQFLERDLRNLVSPVVAA